MSGTSKKRKPQARSAFSAAGTGKTVGRRYSLAKDCDAISLREVTKAADEAIERLGLKRKPLTPSQSFAHTYYSGQVRAAVKS